MPFTLGAHFAGVLCDATNHLNVKIVIRSSQIALVLALFAALGRFGIVGVATAFALGQVAVAVALLFVISGILDTTPRALLRACTPGAGAGACAAVLIGVANVAGTRVGAPPIVTLLIQIGLGLTVVAFWMLKAHKRNGLAGDSPSVARLSDRHRRGALLPAGSLARRPRRPRPRGCQRSRPRPVVIRSRAG